MFFLCPQETKANMLCKKKKKNDVSLSLYWASLVAHLVNNLPNLIVNKRVWNTVLGCNLKNDRMTAVRFQDKPVSVTVIQDYAPTTNAKEA